MPWPSLTCSRSKTRFKPTFLVSERDLAEYLTCALEHADADVRREAVQRISETRYRSRPVVVDALDLIARSDTSEMVRCAAIRALGESCDPRTAETMMAVLQRTPGEGASVARISGDGERQAAMQVLARHAARDPQLGDAVCTAATGALRSDPSRDVRLLAARVLGFCPDLEPLRTLIATLRSRDFGVVHEAERSLMRLTGTTFAHDPQRWELWLASADDPFAQRGLLDEELERQP